MIHSVTIKMSHHNLGAVFATALSAFLSVSHAATNARENSVAAAPSPRVALSLTVDPGFTRDQMPPDAGVWYDRLWKAIAHPKPGKTTLTPGEMATSNSGLEMAASNNTYVYGRALSNYVLALLGVFRVTRGVHLLLLPGRWAE